MFSCFACRKEMSDPDALLKHIESHKIIKKKGIFQCTITTCWKIFNNWASFKKHVKRCCAKIQVEENDRHDELYHYSYGENLFAFEEGVNQEMLKFVSGCCANMRTPRSDIYKMIALMRKTFLPKVISGITDVIGPCVPSEMKDTVDYFVESLKSSVNGVKTEARLNKSFSDLGLIGELRKFDLCEFNEPKPKPKKPRKKRSKTNSRPQDAYVADGTSQKRPHQGDSESSSEESDACEESDVCEESDACEDEGIAEEAEEEVIHITRGEVLVMPIEFQIKKFFELPHVFEKVKENTQKLLQSNELDHYINGTLWREKMKKFKPGQTVIPFHFYGDGAQMNNPIGPHTSELQFNYIAFPTIPSQFQSSWENIFVAQIYPAKYHQDYTTEKIYNSIIGIFSNLWEKGVTLSINGEEITVYFVFAQFIGDTKEQNQRLGFSGSLSGTHCCRFCDMRIDDIRSKEVSDGANRRNIQNYDKHVATNNLTSTGIKEFSPFNRIPCFHVTEGVSVDIAHDLLEGILHPSVCLSILNFMDKNYFDLEFLNGRMKSMDFGVAEKGNIPAKITLKRLNSWKLKMTASEMLFFINHLTLMIGHKVPVDDEVWQHVKTTVRFVYLCYLHKYKRQAIVALKEESKNLNRSFKDLFGKTLQHKSHLTTHYDELTNELGPLRYLQTIRYEGKHKEMKSYAKNINSRRNLPFSIGKKLQHQFAFRLLQCHGLEDVISVPKYRSGSLQDQEYYSRLFDDPIITELVRTDCFFAKKAIINGITFSTELWLPDIDETRNTKIFEVIDIILVDLDDIEKIYVVCKKYTKVMYDDHYACDRVDITSVQNQVIVMNVNDYLTQHLYPVKVHKIAENKYLFRRKHF